MKDRLQPPGSFSKTRRVIRNFIAPTVLAFGALAEAACGGSSAAHLPRRDATSTPGIGKNIPTLVQAEQDLQSTQSSILTPENGQAKATIPANSIIKISSQDGALTAIQATITASVATDLNPDHSASATGQQNGDTNSYGPATIVFVNSTGKSVDIIITAQNMLNMQVANNDAAAINPGNAAQLAADVENNNGQPEPGGETVIAVILENGTMVTAATADTPPTATSTPGASCDNPTDNGACAPTPTGSGDGGDGVQPTPTVSGSGELESTPTPVTGNNG